MTEEVTIIKGMPENRILISAPHSQTHKRNGKPKWADLYTDDIARDVARKTGCHCMYLSNEVNYDPNNNYENSYKETLRQYIQANGIEFVIDLHGMSDKHPYQVEIGTSIDYTGKPEMVEPVIRVFKDHFHDDVVIDQFFTASKTQTITRFVIEQCQIPAVQIEVSRTLRQPPQNSIGEALKEAVEELKRHL